MFYLLSKVLILRSSKVKETGNRVFLVLHSGKDFTLYLGKVKEIEKRTVFVLLSSNIFILHSGKVKETGNWVFLVLLSGTIFILLLDKAKEIEK